MASLKRKLSTDENSSECSGDNMDQTIASAEENSAENGDTANITDHLRQFDVIDEVQGDESGSEIGDNDHRGKCRNVILFNSKFKQTSTDWFEMFQKWIQAIQMLRRLTSTICWMKDCRMICVSERRCITMKKRQNLFWKVVTKFGQSKDIF